MNSYPVAYGLLDGHDGLINLNWNEFGVNSVYTGHPARSPHALRESERESNTQGWSNMYSVDNAPFRMTYPAMVVLVLIPVVFATKSSIYPEEMFMRQGPHCPWQAGKCPFKIV